jgi:hypothetical protein
MIVAQHASRQNDCIQTTKLNEQRMNRVRIFPEEITLGDRRNLKRAFN